MPTQLLMQNLARHVADVFHKLKTRIITLRYATTAQNRAVGRSVLKLYCLYRVFCEQIAFKKNNTINRDKALMIGVPSGTTGAFKR